jgi:hypothetical protein
VNPNCIIQNSKFPTWPEGITLNQKLSALLSDAEMQVIKRRLIIAIFLIELDLP